MSNLTQDPHNQYYEPLLVTESAEHYLADLLKKQQVENMAVRVFITQPGTPAAETCLAYCRPGDEEPTDQRRPLSTFDLLIDARSEPFLHEAVVDYSADRMGGQLTIKAPHARLSQIDVNSSLEEQINYYLYTEINPGLAMHGGEVRLVKITEENYAVLQFGGGCQGCAAIDVTLKDGVEKILKEQIPDLAGILDATDHTDNRYAYY